MENTPFDLDESGKARLAKVGAVAIVPLRAPGLIAVRLEHTGGVLQLGLTPEQALEIAESLRVSAEKLED